VEAEARTAAIEKSDVDLRALLFGSGDLYSRLAKVDDASSKELLVQLVKRLRLANGEPSGPTARDRVEVMRATIRHENDLINHRITWLTVFNGFALSYLNGGSQSEPAASRWWRELSCEVAAILICLSAGFALALAHVAIRRQIDAFKSAAPGVADDAPGEGILGVRVKFGSTFFPRLVIPALLIGVWVLRLLKTTTALTDGQATALASLAVVATFLFWKSCEGWK
jgi:hypothetical protein